MKKSLITLLLVIPSFFLLAQNYSTTIGLKAMPCISTVYNHPQKYAFSTLRLNSFGIELRKQLRYSRFHLQSGIYSINRGFQHFNSISTGFNTVWHYISIQQHLNIPFSIVYKRNEYYYGIGGNINYYLSHKYYEDSILVSTKKPDNAKNVIIGGQAFIGYDFNLGEHWRLGVEVLTNLTINPNILNFGLGLTTKYAFGNSCK